LQSKIKEHLMCSVSTT